jgi:signal transduction histidine kinase/CheY-like chemotaxis protein
MKGKEVAQRDANSADAGAGDGLSAEWRRQHRLDVRKGLDAIYLVQLRTIMLVMMVYYGVTTVAHMLLLPDDFRLPVTLIALTAFLASTIVHILTRLGRISPERSHLWLLPSGLSGLALVYAHVWFSGDIHQMTNGVLIVLAFGFVTLLPVMYLFLTSLSVIFYVLILVFMGGEWAVHYAFMGFAGFLLSLLCFIERYKSLSNVERLLIADRAKSRALEEKAREATDLLHTAEQAAAEARKANEAKSAFLANTSHELRTPMTGVLGMMQLLGETRLDKEQAELVSAAQFSANTLLTLINDILDLTKLDEGKLKLHAEPFDIRSVVQRTADLMIPAAAEKGLQLRCHGPEAPLMLVGDSVRIGQILFNLIGNAVKFTEEGSVDVICTTEEQGAGRHRLTLTVTDTGIGFDAAMAEQLFKRFEQVDGSMIKRQAGAGLGLAICRELAGLMDGTITAESEPGKGARFTFEVTLRLAGGETDEEAQVETEEMALQEMPLSVLIAEDNRVNQILIGKLLASMPWTLTTVDNGAKAVETVLAEDFDLVLMDVRMPVMDGVSATRSIRAAKGPRSSTPIIALTANTMADDIEAYEAAGMDAVVGKPIDVGALKQAVARTLASARTDMPGAGV